mmetsp:Transcript_18745/g.25976  ORF Transcript_18745/g.25976 Transcript_18745/m.25976 type:complete len:179 (+) Transcript_18745:193-729(+)|eukprot:CAMPEP_0196572924 /NCGR_PEP_ID=MMETSP1081-20130531/2893_1 /TAXON_ID=36882 /ORGANISM="Pyramimonas amylifera, Strain CCMP720" /LENGTH=178 /DNA_ID=CAMNT_0041890431 /DNA_START=187 /DNA_END=723 /DNA_ORIENTATION=-
MAKSGGNSTSREPVACRKKEFRADAENTQWDFLKGSGPSAPPRVLLDPPKDKFKPDWKTIKPMHAIDPHRPSYETEQRRDERYEKNAATRAHVLNIRDKQNGFNPITGQNYQGANPPGPAPRGMKHLPDRPPVSHQVVDQKMKSMSIRAELRADRLRSDGLLPGAKVASVADNFDSII